ncbi:hypothetical protein PAALTS15_20778 [Paenibacillus alvei TS-15]|uniref:Uncharacterized protein n=1 Tax=Paenibacillus alvei TS-15 TaxID=1117108 RepID=S9SKZ6_PAEAL|nr:hypothetical protein [Paenibacillus alvei]EPY05364.1 hypothetical protein PAALTS15_20778 [Paenibacillus alvei TS-15]
MEKVHYRKFTRDEFDAGVWGQMRRVALDQNGQVIGIHHADDTNKWADGSDVDWTAYENNVWNCMVQIPKFYYRIMRGDHIGYDTYRCEISNIPESGYKLHPAFEREDGVIENYQYMSAFEGWIDAAGRLRSLPNKKPADSKTIAEFRACAKRNGDHFTQQDFYLLSAIQMLYLVEYGGFNARKLLAQGVVIASASMTGLSLDLGNKSSGASKTFMSYRGIENLYGNYFKFIDGINTDYVTVYLAKNNFVSDKFSENYKKVGVLPKIPGYIKKFHNLSDEFDFAFIPSEVGASENSHVSDYIYSPNYPQSKYVVFSGGRRNHEYSNGLFSLNVTMSASESGIYYSARLQCIKG